MLKETETKVFVTFLPLVAFELEGGGRPPLATPIMYTIVKEGGFIIMLL